MTPQTQRNPRSHDEAKEERASQIRYLISLLTHDEICWLKFIGDYIPTLERRMQIKVIVIAIYNTERMLKPGQDRLFDEARLDIFQNS